MLSRTKHNLYAALKSFAKKRVVSKLEKLGINLDDLRESAVDDLVDDEIEILGNDAKKTSASIFVAVIFGLVVGI